MKEYYQLLGLPESATDEEIKNRYHELKEKYREERWQDGEAGNEASRMLTKLETAYSEIVASRKEKEKKEDGEMGLEAIAALIRENKINEAQAKLDDCNERTAEWHYLQAVVFYKKNWTNESRKQLEIAMQMEPNNAKYSSAYAKITVKNDFNNQTAGNTQNPYSYRPNNEQMGGAGMCSDCCTCCYTYLCVDCLFSLCCGCR